MDEGLDIALAYHAAVLHAALDSRPARLAAALQHLAALPGASLGHETAAGLVRAILSAFGLVPDWAAGERTAAWLQQASERRVLALGAPDYPPLLAAIPDPPPLLFVDGSPSALLLPQLAVVGSRRATPFAREFAAQIAADLARSGLVVTSGLARGVDGAAHAGALAAGGGSVAVFGCGIDQIYPRQHAALAERVRGAGALVSEFPLGTPPRPSHFPRRNRIISGLALGTLVVEAAVTSGSLVTARHALEQGREVFAVPGAVRNPLSRGCHALLRDGATLVESAADILDALPGFVPRLRASACSDETDIAAEPSDTWCAAMRAVHAACDFEARGIDRIVEECGLTAPEVSSILTALEMQGVVRAIDGGVYVLTGKIPA
ncbi:MAG TPA: DNA-processing protein DprA [Gammaproteobacteria bacterium]|nr:DNA-processing protein DprA [Gammaproteobacteria bacterium]